MLAGARFSANNHPYLTLQAPYPTSDVDGLYDNQNKTMRRSHDGRIGARKFSIVATARGDERCPAMSGGGGPAPRTLAKFIVSGGSAATVFLVLSYTFARLGAPPFLASVAAYALAFGIGYGLQRGWTFGARHSHGHAFPRYLAAQVGFGLFSGLVSHVAVSEFGVSALQMAVATTLIVGALSFVVSRWWVFPEG